MALVAWKFTLKMLSRRFSTEPDIKKSVFLSQSKDIFTNLALEDWLYRNFDFTNHHVLMLWRNDPCVVIGRHQNPWLEANVANLHNITENGVRLARRNSGGGAVYHDGGNLNLTFFTSRNHYNRNYNLEIITRALFREYGVRVEMSSRQDLVLSDKKISGTAAKLGRPNSYHHCTLLVNVDKHHLRQALQNQEIGIQTNATKSISSKIMNLSENNPKITVDNLMKVVGWEYLRTPALTVKDGGMKLANKQNGFQMVNPTDEWFPGLLELKTDMESWDWCFGKTPDFTISRTFVIPENLTESTEQVKITIVVENGKISDINLLVPPILGGVSGNVNVITSLMGHRFSDDTLTSLEWSVNGFVNEKDKFVTDCFKQVMLSV